MHHPRLWNKIISGNRQKSDTTVQLWEPIWVPLSTTGILMMDEPPMSNIAPLVLEPAMIRRESYGIEHWRPSYQFDLQRNYSGISILKQKYGDNWESSSQTQFLETFLDDVVRAKAVLPHAPINANRLMQEMWLLIHFVRQSKPDATGLVYVSPLDRMAEFERLFSPERQALERALFADQPYQGNLTYFRQVSQALWNDGSSLLDFFQGKTALTAYAATQKLRTHQPSHPLLIREVSHLLEILKQEGSLREDGTTFVNANAPQRFSISPERDWARKDIQPEPDAPILKAPATPRKKRAAVKTASRSVAAVEEIPVEAELPPPAPLPPAPPSPPVIKQKVTDMESGCQVRHSSFGDGEITSVERRKSDGTPELAYVRFSDGQVKLLNIKMAGLAEI